MCGIAGIFHLDGAPVDASIPKEMASAISHRGPDGEGVFVDGAIGLGHCRLSIIDLSDGGHQPMTSGSGRFVISYNGELYNYEELREDLQRKGCQFISKSDTEVMLAALEWWGEDALKKFNGMFAFALWDKKEQTLMIARDRYGIKPYILVIGN